MIYDMKNASQAYKETYAMFINELEQTKDEIAFLIQVAIKKKAFEMRYEKFLPDEILTWLQEENGYTVIPQVSNYDGRIKNTYLISWANGWIEPETINDAGESTQFEPITGGEEAEQEEEALYTREQLLNYTVSQIFGLAMVKGYTLNGVNGFSSLDAVITAFLAAQDRAQT